MTGDFVFFGPEGRILPWVSDPADQVPGPHRPAVLSTTSRWQPRSAMLLQFPPPSAGCGHHKNTEDTDTMGPGSCGTHRRTHLCTRHMHMHAHTDSWRSLLGNQLPEHHSPSRTEGVPRILALGSPFRRGDPLCSSSSFPSLISFLRRPQVSTSQ